MDLGIAGKRAFVSASSRGIGRACALRLAAEGAKVALCARNSDALRDLCAAMGGAAAGHAAFACDLMHDGAPAALAARIAAEFGPLDIIVHNMGGTLGQADPFAPLAAWHAVWRANVGVAIELNNELVPGMMERGYGRVVFISSLAAVEHQASIPYAAAKAALTAYARSLARAIANSGVVLSSVLPGPVLTEGNRWDQLRRSDPQAFERYADEHLPRGEFGTPEGVAGVVAFLCSAHARECAGSIVPIDGGQGRSFLGL